MKKTVMIYKKTYPLFLISNGGQALITLLFFTVIAINVTAAAVVIIMLNSLSGAKLQQGVVAYEIAQTGIENAKLRLLRDPEYTGESLQVGDGTAAISVSKNDTQYTIISRGTIGNSMRQIQLAASYSANLLVVSSQEEIF